MTSIASTSISYPLIALCASKSIVSLIHYDKWWPHSLLYVAYALFNAYVYV